MTALFGVATALLAAIGALRVLQGLGEALRRFGHGIVNAWRARSAARERRRVQRVEGIGALNAQIAADLAPVVAALHAQLTEARAELARQAEDRAIGAALARPRIVK